MTRIARLAAIAAAVAAAAAVTIAVAVAAVRIPAPLSAAWSAECSARPGPYQRKKPGLFLFGGGSFRALRMPSRQFHELVAARRQPAHFNFLVRQRSPTCPRP